MTKVTILGQESIEKVKEPIQFTAFLNADHEMKFTNNLLSPRNWDEIILLSKGYKGHNLDLMFAKGRLEDEFESCLYLGYFNDGVV